MFSHKIQTSFFSRCAFGILGLKILVLMLYLYSFISAESCLWYDAINNSTYPFNKITGCLSVCLFVPKDLANRWTYMVLLYRVGSGKIYNYFGRMEVTGTPSPKIVINLPWAYKKLYCKGEPCQFSYKDPLLYKYKQTSCYFIILMLKAEQIGDWR